ncbi:MAG: S-layer homology domain-containing protein [Coprothermobacterota bacterium]|nr:S-layer homology domain-containing protein [Coprothermobacterota bacterium]
MKKSILCIAVSVLILLNSAAVLAESTPQPLPPPAGGLVLHLELEKSRYAPGEPVPLRMVLENPMTIAVDLTFNSGQQYDIEVRGPNGYFWRWSKDRAFTQIFGTMTIKPGEKIVFLEPWPIPQTAAAGNYSIVAWITAQEGQPRATGEVTVESGLPPSGPQVVYLADEQGGVILAITDRADLLTAFRRMLAEGNFLWVGGAIEKADNAPWSFRFTPATLSVAEVTAGALQSPSIAAIEEDLSRWLDISQAYIHAQVLGIDPLPFPDVEGNWAYHSILSLFHQGVVQGYPDGAFRPERPITRAEFAKMMASAYNLPVSHPAVPTFSDLPATHWAFDLVEAAAQSKLFLGYPDGAFRPEDPVTKEQVVAVLVRKAGWTLSTPSSPTFSDLPPVEWSFPFVETAMKEGLFLPNDPNLAGDLFQGNAPATRAQISVLVARLLAQYSSMSGFQAIAADSGGGFVPVEFFRQHVPAFHLYGDGLVIALRGGSVRQATFTYTQGMDLVIVLMAYGFLQMESNYQPEPMPTDLGTTYIRWQGLVSQKEVSEYAWGAPGAFHYLYSYLRNVPLEDSQEYIPEKSALFVSKTGDESELSDDQKERLVSLPAAFTENIDSLAQLALLNDGYALNRDLYALLAPLLADHQRVIVAVEGGVAYSLIVKIELPESQTASGISGAITLGPIQPVSKPGEVNEEPYQATVAVRDEAGIREITRFTSDPKGAFQQVLPPGTYQLFPLPGGSPFPQAGAQAVTVLPGQFTEVKIQYDTGIR